MQVRKLEFLMADALAKGADTVVTVGGIQSNHCRATAVAARHVSLALHQAAKHSCFFLELRSYWLLFLPPTYFNKQSVGHALLVSGSAGFRV